MARPLASLPREISTAIKNCLQPLGTLGSVMAGKQVLAAEIVRISKVAAVLSSTPLEPMAARSVLMAAKLSTHGVKLSVRTQVESRRVAMNRVNFIFVCG